MSKTELSTNPWPEGIGVGNGVDLMTRADDVAWAFGVFLAEGGSLFIVERRLVTAPGCDLLCWACAMRVIHIKLCDELSKALMVQYTIFGTHFWTDDVTIAIRLVNVTHRLFL